MVIKTGNNGPHYDLITESGVYDTNYYKSAKRLGPETMIEWEYWGKF